MFRNRTELERKLEKQLIKSAKKIREGIADDMRQREIQEEEDRKRQVWSAMSPRLKLKLLKRAEERRQSAKEKK